MIDDQEAGTGAVFVMRLVKRDNDQAGSLPVRELAKKCFQAARKKGNIPDTADDSDRFRVGVIALRQFMKDDEVVTAQIQAEIRALKTMAEGQAGKDVDVAAAVKELNETNEGREAIGLYGIYSSLLAEDRPNLKVIEGGKAS